MVFFFLVRTIKVVVQMLHGYREEAENHEDDIEVKVV